MTTESTTPETTIATPNPTTEAPAPEKESKAKAKKAKAKPEMTEAPVKHFDVDSGDKDALAKIFMPKDESDPHWDPKMLLPVPKFLVSGLALNGWDRSMPLKVTPVEGGFKIVNGRTKMRALPLANEVRKKNKLPPLIIPVLCQHEDEIDGMRTSMRLNEHQQRIDPLTRALTIERLIATGLTEADVAKDTPGLTVKEIEEHLALLTLPKKVQKLVQDGAMTLKSALALVHVDANKVEAVAERLVAQAEAVGKVTAKDAKAATANDSKEPDRLNAKGVKKLISEAKASSLKGKHGEAVQKAFILALETVLDARKVETVFEKLDKLAKGE